MRISDIPDDELDHAIKIGQLVLQGMLSKLGLSPDHEQELLTNVRRNLINFEQEKKRRLETR